MKPRISTDLPLGSRMASDHLEVRRHPRAAPWNCSNTTVLVAMQKNRTRNALLAESFSADCRQPDTWSGMILLSRLEENFKLHLPAIIPSGVSSRLLEQEAEQYGCQLIKELAQPMRLRQALAAASATKHLSLATHQQPKQAC